MTSSNQTLFLPRPLVNKILAHAQQHPDIEVCGLIGNDSKNNKNYYRIDNISKNLGCRFEMDAPQQIKAMKNMREKQQALFAIVHSHPTTNAQPSTLDIEESSYKEAYYIIISLNTKGVLEMRAFAQQKESMREIDLILENIDS